MSRRVLLVGNPKSRAITGQTLAFDMLTEECRQRHLHCQVIDKSGADLGGSVGKLSWGRALRSVQSIAGTLAAIWGYDCMYLLIAPTRLGFLRDMLLIFTARLAGRRVILHYHGGGFDHFLAGQPALYRRLALAALRRAHILIVLGELIRQQFERLLPGYAGLRVVENGLPPSSDPGRLAVKSWTPGEPLRLLYLSNLIESKGYRDLLRACKLLAERGVPFECHFCGKAVAIGAHGTDAEADFRAEIAALGLEEVVTFHGQVTGEAKLEQLHRCHLLALPTYYPWEGQPLAIIEGLAYATPIVCTPHSGLPELVRDGWNGRLVQPRSPESLAGVVAELASQSAESYGLLSEHALEHYRSNFTAEAHLNKLVETVFHG